MDLITNLKAYYKCDEASGNLLDSLGVNDLTAVNAPLSATGIKTTGRDLELGSQQYFNRADNTDFSTGDVDFTIAAWAQLESFNGFMTVVGKGIWGSHANSEYLLRYLNSSNRWDFLVDDGTTTGTVSVSTVLLAPAWYFLVAWHDSVANTINLQVNNGTVASVAWTTGLRDGTDTFCVGAASTPNTWWDGVIDEVGFWKKILTAEERTWLYNSGRGKTYEDFVNIGQIASVIPNYSKFPKPLLQKRC